MSAGSEPVVVEVAVAAPVPKVWESLRAPELILRWHGWHYDDLAAEVDSIYLQDVVADEQTHTLQLSDGDRFEVLTGEPAGAVVRVVRPPNDPGSEWSDYYDEITEGWLSFLQQLRFMHEVQPGRERRTIFLSGTGAPELLPELLGSVPTATGSARYSTASQSGLELPELGPGLLVTATKPAVGDGSGGAVAEVMAIVSTYGLSDADFAEQIRLWGSWWRSSYPDSDEPQV